jgi:hypothetical protein
MKTAHIQARHNDSDEPAAAARRRAPRVVSLLASIALLAAACGGAAHEAEPVEESATATEQQNQTVDAEPAASDAEQDPGPAEEVAASEWSVSVVTAKESTGVVPTFDGPGGTEVFFELPIANPTYFGNTLSLLVVDGNEGDEWVQVQLPVRRVGQTDGESPEVHAWVQTEFFEWGSHEFHATVDLSDRSLQVWDGDELVAESQAVIGRPAAPTPILRTYVDEIIPGDGAGYGSWIISLASYSQKLDSFDGGLPKLALHGTNAPELVGQEVSSGCVRLPNDVIELLASTIPVGTVVEIVA